MSVKWVPYDDENQPPEVPGSTGETDKATYVPDAICGAFDEYGEARAETAAHERLKMRMAEARADGAFLKEASRAAARTSRSIPRVRRADAARRGDAATCVGRGLRRSSRTRLRALGP